MAKAKTTVELFAGIGGFRIAADRVGFKTLWANDLNPKSCEVYRKCFGAKEMHEGDINSLLDTIPEHDILTGGFPCQPFSAAGKKEGIRDSRGTLFETIVRVLEEKRPSMFVLENVKRLLSMESGAHFATILKALSTLNYRIEWRLLNAMNFGLPQNRQRVVLVGVRLDKWDGDLTDKLLLAPAKDFGTAKDAAINDLHAINNWGPIEKHGSRFPFWGIAVNGKFYARDLDEFSEAQEPVLLKKILQDKVSNDFYFTESTLSWIANNTEVNKFVDGVEILSNQLGGARMGYTIFGINGVAPTLTSTTSRHYERYKMGDEYRRLTNIEYARIQGFPDEHCDNVSTYNQYALYGNAVPPNLVEWVFRSLLAGGFDAPKASTKQLALIPGKFVHAR